MQKLFDWFVPPSARGNAMLEVRYRGVAQALLAISGVVALLAAMWALLSGGILSPSAPWMLALMAVWAGFGDRRFVIWAGTIVALCTAGLYAATINAWLPPSNDADRTIAAVRSAVAIVCHRPADSDGAGLSGGA